MSSSICRIRRVGGLVWPAAFPLLRAGNLLELRAHLKFGFQLGGDEETTESLLPWIRCCCLLAALTGCWALTLQPSLIIILGVREKYENWEALLEDGLMESCSAPANLLEGVSGWVNRWLSEWVTGWVSGCLGVASKGVLLIFFV